MITHSFDPDSEAVITPASLFGERRKICDIAIATFSREIYPAVLEKYPNEQIAEIRAANRIRPVHLLTLDAQLKAVFYLSEIGAAMAGTDVIEINWKTGADRFILSGSAGALDQEATAGKYIVPTAAYRDEGMSYHYAPPSDYISIPKADALAGFFSGHHLPFVKGKVWTTDAFYMETRELVRKRKAEGCIAVEMELAGVQAVCDHYGFELYDFLLTGDVVDQPLYSPEGLAEANHSFDQFDIAVMIAKNL